jgi:predicted MPP superfamily phosphohydrolase
MMFFVYGITAVMLAADAWWWHYADRAVRRRKLHKAWRWGVAAWAGLLMLGIVLLIAARMLHMREMIMPEAAVVVVFIWHFVMLPLLLVPSLLQRGVSVVTNWSRRRKPPAPDAPPDVGRRAFLAQSLVIVPPLATLALTGKAAWEEDDFRVRRATLALRQLPRGLDGMTIAFVSDPHIGSFMSDRKFRGIIETANALDADLVLHGGDLINSSLSDLPDGIDLLRQFRGRYGVYSCQGNHDCIADRAIFERDTRRAGIAMLLDEIQTVRVRGEPVQIIAPAWVRRRNEQSVISAATEVVARRDPNQFSLLLAHHPHAFDSAAAAGVPLTLAGHTHGGQLALTQQFSVGALMYRYYSGEYRIDDSACCVTNGVGNWFPLRVNVPAEIVHLTLTCA